MKTYNVYSEHKATKVREKINNEPLNLSQVSVFISSFTDDNFGNIVVERIRQYETGSGGSLPSETGSGVKYRTNPAPDPSHTFPDGVYETMYGNACEWRNSEPDKAYDLDMREEIPVEMVLFSNFLRSLDE